MIKVGAIIEPFNHEIRQLFVVYWHISDKTIETDKPNDYSYEVLQNCFLYHFRLPQK